MCHLLRSIKRLFARRPATGLPIIYELPNPSIHNKAFNRNDRFSGFDWTNWSKVIDGFEKRFKEWYFCHLRWGDESYVHFCALCALVDVFTYYDNDNDWHDQGAYKKFLRKLDPIFQQRLAPPINVSRSQRGKWKIGSLQDIADVFYSGVRCSLHHHGDLAPYAGMRGTGKLAQQFPKAGQSLCGKFTYPLVIFDPAELGNRLRKWFADWCDDLRKNPSSPRAVRFRRKFLRDFGINIPP